MRIAVLLALAVVLAGCGGTKTTTTTVTHTVTQTVTTQASGFNDLGSPSSIVYFGQANSISDAGEKGYLVDVTPQFFLMGVTANSAGETCDPLSCPAVPNDYRVIPAGSTNLIFVLPATTKGTVLTQQPASEGGGMESTTITAAQLSALVAGGTSPKLFEPLDGGLWFQVNGDTVTAFAQEYRP